MSVEMDEVPWERRNPVTLGQAKVSRIYPKQDLVNLNAEIDELWYCKRQTSKEAVKVIKRCIRYRSK